jgi:diguanylate cyclase (GGDEF)-like protein
MKTRVLVIDDEEAVRKSIKNSLSILPVEQEAFNLSQKIEVLFGPSAETSTSPFFPNEEFDVTLVSSGEEGFQIVKKAMQNEDPFQAIFIDIRMPGMGGDECGKLIRELDPYVGICLITGYSDKNVTLLVKNIGGTLDNVLFLKKPFNDDEVRQISRAFSARWYAELKSRAFQKGLQNLIDNVLTLREVPLTDAQDLLKAMLEHILAFIGVKNGFIASINDKGKLHFEVGSGMFENQADINYINLPGNFYERESLKDDQNYIMKQFNDNVVISMLDRESRKVVVIVGSGLEESENKYFIKILSENAAISLRNAGLFKKIQEVKNSLEATVKERTLELEKANRTLKELVVKDQLTNLYNRRYFEEMLETIMTRSKEENKDLALMMIDIDFFKLINDKYGHKEGDHVLMNLAAILTESLSKTDIISRYGADEFLVLLSNVDPQETNTIAQRIAKKFAQLPFKNKYPDVKLELSIGIAALFSDVYYVKSGVDFFQKADEALLLAKRNGRNRIETWKLSDELYTPQYEIKWRNIQDLVDKIATGSLKTTDEYVEEVASIISILESKDPFTANHSKNVALYTKEFLLHLNLESKYTDEIYRASVLHDIGKIGIPDAILLKNEPLTAEEIKIIENHPLISVKILKKSLFQGKEILIVKHHHERFDGKGYPDGLKNKHIPYGSRIISIVDTFDALTNNRPYRKRMSVDEALLEMKRCSGSQFDPEILEKFISLVVKNKDTWPIRQ